MPVLCMQQSGGVGQAAQAAYGTSNRAGGHPCPHSRGGNWAAPAVQSNGGGSYPHGALSGMRRVRGKAVHIRAGGEVLGCPHSEVAGLGFPRQAPVTAQLDCPGLGYVCL